MTSQVRFLCIVLAIMLLLLSILSLVCIRDMQRINHLTTDDLMRIPLLDTPNSWLLDKGDAAPSQETGQ